MLDACVMMTARDSEDYLDLCVRAVAPHVKKVKITVDSRSSDGTWRIATSLMKEFGNVQATVFRVEYPIKDLVSLRNSQLPFDEEWGFIIDSDEFHYDVNNYFLGSFDSYALQCYAVWDKTHAHRASSKARIGRIFRNYGKIEWKGKWGKEILCRDGKPIFTNAKLLPSRYIHFTHVKKDQWRKEMRQERVADGKYLIIMPDHIINLLSNIYAQKM